MEIIQRPGKQNQNADTLSRIDRSYTIRPMTVETLQPQQKVNLQSAQIAEFKLAMLINFISSGQLPDDNKLAGWVTKASQYFELVDHILYRSANTF